MGASTSSPPSTCRAVGVSGCRFPQEVITVAVRLLGDVGVVLSLGEAGNGLQDSAGAAVAGAEEVVCCSSVNRSRVPTYLIVALASRSGTLARCSMSARLRVR